MSITAGALSSVATSPIAAFVPAYATAMFVADFITAILLFAQFSLVRSRAILVIASGYLFTAFILIPWILTFPGVFASPRTRRRSAEHVMAVLRAARRPAAVRDRLRAVAGRGAREDGSGTARCARAIGRQRRRVAAADFADRYVCIAHEALLPRVVLDSLHLSPVWPYAGTPVALLSVAALVLLWKRRRSVLDLWLMVVMCLYTIEIPLSYYPDPVRFSVGWYTVRVIGVCRAASC